MFDKLQIIETRYDELMNLLNDGGVQSDPNKYRTHSKALSEIQPVVEKFRDHKTVESEIAETPELAGGADVELRELAEQELTELEARRDGQLAEIRILMVPKDPNDEKNVVLEIRAGTGGDEAGLFAHDLYRMYARFAERQHWRSTSCRRTRAGWGPSTRSSPSSRARGSTASSSTRARPPRAAGARDRGERPHPHLDRDRRGAARGRGGGPPSTAGTCASTPSARAALVVCPLNNLTVQLPWARHGGLQSAPENSRFCGLVGHGRRCKAISQTYH